MTSENEQKVLHYFNRHLRTLLQKAKIHLAIPRSSIQWTLWNRFQLFLYRFHIVQELEESDYKALAKFENGSLQNVETDKSFLNHIFSSEERVFHVGGNVIKQNAKIWGSKNYYETEEVSSRDSEKVNLCCALSIKRVIGPYIFDDPIVTGDSHLHLVNNYFIQMSPKLPTNTIFQQGGAPLHYGRAVPDLLDKQMPDL